MIEQLSDLAYVALTAAITFLVGWSLQKRGVEPLTTFYLLAFGFISLVYRWGAPKDMQQAADQLSTKLGLVLLLLGLLHAVKSRRKKEPVQKETVQS